MVLLAFAAWVWTASRAVSGNWRVIGGAFAFAGLAAVLALLIAIRVTEIPPAAAMAHAETNGIPCEAYTAAKVQEARAQKRPVFIDATAAWCITCLVNEKVALSGSRIRDAFAAKHMAYFVADWTSRNPEITALLAAHGRSGVPLYLYYAPGAADAVVLPQILTEDEVLKTIGN
jgi:thiol:disulfide interchange protein DsbD